MKRIVVLALMTSCAAFVAACLTVGITKANAAQQDGDDILLHLPAIIAEIQSRRSEGQVVGPDGAKLEFENGVVLDIPPGALGESVVVSLTSVGCDIVTPILGSRAISSLDKRCLASVSAEPDGLVFAVPVTMTLPVRPLENGELPLWAIMDVTEQTYEFVRTSVVSQGNENLLQVEITHFSDHAAVGGKTLVEVTGDPLDPCCSQVPTPLDCCCSTFKATSNAGDVLTGAQCDDCQIVGEELTVEFIACPNSPTHTSKFSESSPGCPEDLQLQINPSDPTFWTCETGKLDATLDGTNSDGGACSFAAPVDWAVTANDPQVTLNSKDPNEATVRALEAGTATVDVTSPVWSALRASATVSFKSLSGLWQETLLSGSEVCVSDGQAIVEDEGPAQFNIDVVQACSLQSNTLTISSPDIPTAAPFTGNLTETGEPSRPFDFNVTVSSSQTPDCIVFMDSNGGDIIFGDEPVCPPGGPQCEAISCFETETANGKISSADTGKLQDGDSQFEFAATWDVLLPDPNTGQITRERRSIQCDGTTTFIADKL